MEVGEDALDPLCVVQLPLDSVSTCPQQYKPCRAGTNSGRPQMTSKTPLTGCQVKPPYSCTPMKLKALGPHALSHGRTDDQLECRLPWQSPRSIGLCGSSCGSSVWTCADGPPGFFQSPVCRASTVSRDIASSPVPSDSSGQSQVPWSIQGPASAADSSPGSQVPKVEIPQVVVECFLSRTHICQAPYSMRADTSAVLPKPMLTGTHISASAVLGEWRHLRIPHLPHIEM